MSGITGFSKGGSAFTDYYADISTPAASPNEFRVVVRGSSLSAMTKANTTMNIRYYLDGSASENLNATYTGYDIIDVNSTTKIVRVYGISSSNIPNFISTQPARFMPTLVYGGSYIQAQFFPAPPKPKITAASISGSTLTVSVSVENTCYFVQGYELYNADTNAIINTYEIAKSTAITNANSVKSYTFSLSLPTPTTRVYVKAFNYLAGTTSNSATSYTSGTTSSGVVLPATKAYSPASDVPLILSSISYSTTNKTTDTKTLKLKITGSGFSDTTRVKASTVSLNIRSHTNQSGAGEILYTGWSNFTWSAISDTQIELSITNLPSSTLCYRPALYITGAIPNPYIQPDLGNLFYTVPSAPTSVYASAVSDGSATITVAGSTAFAISGYNVYNSSTNALMKASSSNVISLTGLTNGTPYQVYVKAYGPQGESTASSFSSAFVPGMTVSAIEQLSASSANNSITLLITGSYLSTVVKSQTYLVVKRQVGGSLVFENGVEYWSNYTVNPLSETQLEVVVSGLTPVEHYSMRFGITNVGEVDSISAIFMIGQPPGAPTNVGVAAGDSQAIVSFTAPLSDGGVSITQYNVYNASNNVLLSYGASSPITIVGLRNGVSYQVYVKAVNSAGESVKSTTSLAFMPISASAEAPCFLGEAPVLTPSGYKRMDSIKVGDKVLNNKGEAVKVEHVELTLCAASSSTNPYVIEKGVLGATERVLISPDHRVSTKGKMVKAKHLDLPREEMNGLIRYYNIQLEGWSNMVVAGLEVESLAPIQRTLLTVPQLVSVLQAKYGSDLITAEITNKVLRTCRLMSDGRVEVPIMRK